MRNLLDSLLLAGTFIVCLVCAVLLAFPIAPFKAEVKYVKTNNATIAYYTRGVGKPILLIEGFGMTMADWDPALIKKLTSHREVIVYDLRRVGLSRGSLKDLSVQAMADDSTGLLDHLGIQSTDILGWSMGSLIAQEIALDHPDRVDHLILASTLSDDAHEVEGKSDTGRTEQDLLNGTWEDLVPLLFTKDSAGKANAEKYILRRNSAIKNGEAPQIPGVTVDVKVAQEQAMGNLSKDDRLKSLSGIQVRTLIIAGEKDTLVPIANDRNVAQAIHGSILHIFPDSGHAFLFRNSNEVYSTINDFLR